MLEFYRVRYSLIRGGKTVVAKYGWHEVLYAQPPQNYRMALTWNDIESVDMCMVSPKILHKKRGKIILYADLDTYICIKEWKEPTLDLEYSVTYQKVNMSLRDILEYYNGEAALRYLAERGAALGIR